jgi:uncharacterized OB-fold protein
MKTLPVPTPLTEPYWEGCRAGELRIQYCRSCDRHQFYPRSVCAGCLGNVEWVMASGKGEVVSYTIVRLAVSEAYAADVPYVVALIRLAEGPQLMSQVDCDVDEIATGRSVEVYFDALSDEVSVPKFRLTG